MSTPRAIFHRLSTPSLLALALLLPLCACGDKKPEPSPLEPGTRTETPALPTLRTTAPKNTPSRDTLTVEAIAIARETLRILRTVEDKRTAAQAANALAPLVGRAKRLKADWASTGKTSLADAKGLSKRHATELKSLTMDAAKTVGILTWRWKAPELRKSIATLRQVLGAANAIRKALKEVK